MHLASHLIAVLHERVDLRIRKTIQVRSNRLHFGLHDRMKCRGVLGQVDHLGDRQENEARLLAKVLPFQLPDPVPENIGSAHGLTKNPQRRLAQNLKRLSGIADQDLVELGALMH